jgi:hypothetical protein
LKSQFLESQFRYDGTQLVSLWNYLQHKILGDSIVSWIGPCQISFEHMVDGEDLLAESAIAGDKMLHFIVEKFDCSLFAAVGLQRLLTSLALDTLRSVGKTEEVHNLTRDGDDIYLGGKKLSISIATQSPVSSLIHFAVNIINSGTPVPTLCLEDLKVEPKTFATEVMSRFCKEVEGITMATQKVRWVK